MPSIIIIEGKEKVQKESIKKTSIYYTRDEKTAPKRPEPLIYKGFTNEEKTGQQLCAKIAKKTVQMSAKRGLAEGKNRE